MLKSFKSQIKKKGIENFFKGGILLKQMFLQDKETKIYNQKIITRS